MKNQFLQNCPSIKSMVFRHSLARLGILYTRFNILEEAKKVSTQTVLFFTIDYLIQYMEILRKWRFLPKEADFVEYSTCKEYSDGI